MKKLTSSFSTKQKPNSNDLIVCINKNKEILFDRSNQSFMHSNILDDSLNYFKIFESDGRSVFLTKELELESSDLCFISKRHMYPYLTDESLTLISRAFQIFDWIFKQNYCSRTGNELSEVREDLSKYCDSCSREYFPKMSPCILAAITFNNKILLVKHNNEIRTLSTVIAGFVELGESLEDCVKREVFEEVGLEIKNIKYLASQSWPFPNQLMMAFSAEAISDQFKIDNDEILEANWYTEENLPQIPPEPSLSNLLIKKTINSLL
tara:strand:+ start:220 stop:1017 length:798 start_codon:yes stop_codon:yes gene_type:complete